MKNLLATFLCIAWVSAFAQTKKGDKLWGVGIGAASYTNSDSKTTYTNTTTVYNSEGNSFNISVYPNIAWFINDNLAIGGSVNLSFYNSKSTSSNTGSTTTVETKNSQPSAYIGPMARYYFGGSSKGMPFAQVNAQYGIFGGKSTSKSSTGSSSDTKTKPKGNWNAGVSFGYEHFITPNIGFYGSLGFNYNKSKTTYEYNPSSGTEYDYTSDYSRFNIPVNVGLQVHILGKKAK
jgi:hypothetical protein